MITGTVNGNREAVLRLTVRGPAGQGRRMRAVIDTGYDGWLTLPPALIAQLGLGHLGSEHAELADGSSCIFDLYEATILWDRRRHLITVHEADTTPLVGMALLEGFDLNIQVRAGGKVTIKPLPRRRVRRPP